MNTMLAVLLAAACGATAVACGSRADSGSGSSTHFFLRECSASNECGGSLSCLCGLCTQTCAAGDECQALAASAVCAPVSSEPQLCEQRLCQLPAAPGDSDTGRSPNRELESSVPSSVPAESDGSTEASCPAGGCDASPPAPTVIASDPKDSGVPFVTEPSATPSTPLTPEASVTTAEAGTATPVISDCLLDACNDHGACIDRETWNMCDCDPQPLPMCLLPLLREIGATRDGEELILTSISGDGSTIIGNHRPLGSPTPQLGVKWTLDDGLEVLPQDPAGPTLAYAINFDGSLISGEVLPSDGSEAFDVSWQEGILAPGLTDPLITSVNPVLTPTELSLRLQSLGIDADGWTFHIVNAESDDGNVMFGWAFSPGGSVRWLLRLR